jgi:outer membrane immunogenic protein
MRRVICALIVFALPSSALAGDFDILRGSEATYRWAGFYGGAQAGYSSSVVNFGTAGGPEVSFLLRDTAIEQDEQISQWTVLGSRQPTSPGLGGFVGYNMEWESLIFGLELNYNHVSLSQSVSGSLTRSFTDSGNLPSGHNYFYTVTAGANAWMHLSDIGTIRARAGYEEGIFLPYAFAGLALARVDTSSGATVSYTAVDSPASEAPPLTPLPNLCVGAYAAPCTYYPALSQGNSQNNAMAYGVTAGLGVDVGVLPNVFVRGELEYIYFAPINGIQFSVATGRVGVGLKF